MTDNADSDQSQASRDGGIHQAFRIDWLGSPRYFHHLIGNRSEIPVSTQPFNFLDNNIHPVWRRSAWRNFPYPQFLTLNTSDLKDAQYDFNQNTYNAMRPALRLATILLERAKPLMVAISRAPFKLVDGHQQFGGHWRPSSDDEAFYNLMLDDIVADSTILTLAPKNLSPESLANAQTIKVIHGMSTTLHDSSPLTTSRFAICSAVAHETLDPYSSIDFYRLPQAQRESMWVHLAQTLVHELAHVVFYRRNYENRYSYLNDADWLFLDEPRIPPVQYSELGNMVSQYLFGFEVGLKWDRIPGTNNLNFPNYDGKGGLRALFQSSTESLYSVILYLIAPETIHSFFNTYTWQQPENFFPGSRLPPPTSQSSKPGLLHFYLLPVNTANAVQLIQSHNVADQQAYDKSGEAVRLIDPQQLLQGNPSSTS